VTLTELRLANGLGGKSFVLMVGDVPNVQAAVEAGVNVIKDQGVLICFVVIPQLAEEMRQKIV